MRALVTLLIVGAMLAQAAALPAAEPVTLENLVAPAPNRADEPLAEKFSPQQAVHFLDSAALEWQNSWGCFTCHTNISYLIARPTVSPDAPAHREVRKYAEELISLRWSEVGSRFDAEIVAVGAALALNDAATTKKLHPLTRLALDQMWLSQREAGDWKWPTGCRWPPMESDQHYGVTLAAIGVGAAPDGYADTPAARAGLEKIRSYLKKHPPENLHHKGMLVWASTYVDGLITGDQRAATIKELIAAARPDGGWAFSTLYPWDRSDDKQQDLTTSDGYGTAFAVFVLRKGSVPVDDPAVARGVAWLKNNQRASGRWFTRSLNKDNEHFISHAGSAYAMMALAACGEVKPADVAYAAVASTGSRGAAKPAVSESVSPPVKDYLAEQQRRRTERLEGLRKRIAEYRADAARQNLLPVLEQQLAELQGKPLEIVSFDSAYGYPPAPGKIGYSKKVRLVENTADGKSIILVDNTALVIGGLGTSEYPSGKFLGVDKAILVGSQREDYTFRGQKKKSYDATLFDLEMLLGAGAK